MSNQKVLFETVVMEIRPRLQSVNVLITLKEMVENIKIVLNENSFDLVATNTTATVSCKNLKIIKESLNSLNITNTTVSFRFGTVNNVNDWGSVKIELLKIANETKQANKPKTVFMNSTNRYTIQCNNCVNILKKDQSFSRILPLPSDNAEPSDWFCHANINYNLNPKENDFFYGNCYCHLRNNLKNTINKNDIILCNDCQTYLGVLKNSEICKLWFNTVRFIDDSNVIHHTDALQDIFLSLKDVLNTAFYSTVKIVLSCRKSNKEIDKVLLWILEKELTVKILDPTEKNCRVAKVLYNNDNEETDKTKIWKQDVNIVCLDISEPMYLGILKHLTKYNNIFPKEFSKSNDFYVSYLMLYDTEE